MEEKEQKLEIQNTSVTDIHRENLRIQKTEWIYDQIQRQRAAEDALFEQMKQEQSVLDALNESIDNNVERTKEARKYNQEFRENMDAQVYAMYGITEDKLQGIREYKNAYYQGCAFSLFFLSMVLVALCGILHGFQSSICLFMIAFSGIEGALLTQEKKRGRVLDMCCKILYLLMFPLMMVIFVCYELEYPEYEILLPIFAIFGICVLIIGTTAYFFYDPYRQDKRKVGDAKGTIREIEKTARKEVRKNQKSREKSEKKQQKLQEKEEIKQRKLLEKSEKKQLRSEQGANFFSRLKKTGKTQEENPESEMAEEGSLIEKGMEYKKSEEGSQIEKAMEYMKSEEEAEKSHPTEEGNSVGEEQQKEQQEVL